jgi:hypothetical protein
MLKVVGDRITYKLTPIEKLGAFGNSPTANVTNLVTYFREENPWTVKTMRGIRAPGTGFPYIIMLGTLWHRRGRDFCVVYKRRPVLVLEFRNEKFKRWVIPASPESESILASLKRQASQSE